MRATTWQCCERRKSRGEETRRLRTKQCYLRHFAALELPVSLVVLSLVVFPGLLPLPPPLTSCGPTNAFISVDYPNQQVFQTMSSPFSTYSSFAEPNPTLFADAAKVSASSETAFNNDDPDAPLRNDIRVMGSLLGKVIRQHEGSDVFQKIEDMRLQAKGWREENQDSAAFAKLTDLAAQLSNQELYSVSRAFTHFLSIANAAEGHHRVRRLQEDSATTALYSKRDSCGGVLPDLLAQGVSKEEIYKALTTQSIELVLTAHPTEVNRRTILNKHRRIQEILTESDALRGSSSAFVQTQLNDAMWREISSLWLSDEVSRSKPTPEDEAERGTLVLETVLWRAVPTFLRKLDATVREFVNPQGLATKTARSPIRFASWMGGDRDGNPNVKPNTTREVCLRNRAKAALLFGQDLATLQSALSITTCNAELRRVVGNDVREPYRAFLRPIMARMQRTKAWAEQELSHLHEERALARHLDPVSIEDIYLSKQKLMDDLMLIHRSLTETGNETEADGILTDIIRNVSAFGLTLIPLDVRQESDRHEEALDAITRFLGLGSYSQWDESTKITWLSSQISSKRPLLRAGVWKDNPDIFSETAVDTLETFQMIADQHEDSLGAYVISQATSASDVLAVLLLQLDAGVRKPLRVAPLFETLSDLNGAAGTMRSLFSNPVYMGHINGKQEIMIGYSDSAKDAGRLSASFAQHETQMELANLADEFGVNLTFFHGKGGTVGRGGSPILFEAIMSHAPNTINGQFRVTEQGEMIQKNFGFGDRAERTMDIYTAAVLAEKLTKRSSPPEEWREMMTELSEISCDAYRRIVRHDDRFVPYFRSATPEVELASLNIGSRPAKRKASGGVESLRAIPWIFAWTQTRFNLPTWLGVGEALGQTLKSDKAPLLREMYKSWDSFRTMVDLVEMVLAKSEPAIAKHYEDMLVDDPKAKELGAEVRAVHLATEQAILDLTEHSKLGENNAILQRALKVRNPYVDCLNVLQAETLKRIRQYDDGQEDSVLKDALMTTITGVANGMGNTG